VGHDTSHHARERGMTGSQPAASDGYEGATISTDLSTKPDVPKPTGTPPAELVTEDVVTGDGRPAGTGDHVAVHYVGVSFSTGKQFDSSWDRGAPFDFPLGAGRVIRGWDFGVTGMREGGRRTLVIPPSLGYGKRGMGPIAPDETLVFVVDLVKVD
jgi:peptidylprolyl isomerase